MRRLPRPSARSPCHPDALRCRCGVALTLGALFVLALVGASGDSEPTANSGPIRSAMTIQTPEGHPALTQNQIATVTKRYQKLGDDINAFNSRLIEINERLYEERYLEHVVRSENQTEMCYREYSGVLIQKTIPEARIEIVAGIKEMEKEFKDLTTRRDAAMRELDQLKERYRLQQTPVNEIIRQRAAEQSAKMIEMREQQAQTNAFNKNGASNTH